MDFAQGIDSDIEEVATDTIAPGNLEIGSNSNDSQAMVVLPVPVSSNVDSDQKVESELEIDEPLPPAPPSPIPILETRPSIPSDPLAISTITNLTDNSTTDEEEDISQITPLPMPILPSLKTDMLQMLETKIPLVDDEEG